MNWLKVTLITVVILAVAGGGGFILYNVAYTAGDANGYDNGYSAGHNVGYSLGEEDGYSDGYALGQDEGYALGEADGYDAGYDNGYADGIEAGAGHGYTLRDPTYAEVVAFLSADTTDQNIYVEDSYVCSHFARDVCNNAEAAGWRCAFVLLDFQGAGHSIIAFNTIDRGLVYFEPQFDDEVTVVIGYSYAQLNGYLYPPYSDIIRDVLIIW
jgi:hypothetical protein